MRALFCLFSLMACLVAPIWSAEADVVHSVKFGMGPVAKVWGEAREAPLTHSPIVTGVLSPASETDGSARFKLATNAPYRILAQRADGKPLRAADLKVAGFDLTLEAVGPNARAAGRTLVESDGSGLIVYASPLPTAAAPGSPDTQSLQFFASWERRALPGGLVFTVLAG